LHRLTGVGLFFALSVLCWWGIIFVFSNYCECLIAFANSIFFKAVILLTCYALFFHLATGIRHLFWDVGYGYSIRAMNLSGWFAVLISFALTAMLYYSIFN
jgi:succinate dehydrogenase / fumarate reductase cytochrome b subunit